MKQQNTMELTGEEKLHGNLPQLQNLIKRDPSMYRDDFMIQLAHFESELKIFQLRPDRTKGTHFGNLVAFLGQCMACYPDTMRQCNFTGRIIQLLKDKYATIDPKLRAKLVATLVLVRNRGLLGSIELLDILFLLFECEDKQLRASLFNYIVSDIKHCSIKNSNAKEMRTVKAFVYKRLKEGSPRIAVRTLSVIVELYRRRVWNDSRTVNVIAEACFSETIKVASGAMRFFLGIEQQMMQLENDEEAQERRVFMSELPSAKKRQHSKLTRKRKRQMERATKKVKKFREKIANKKEPKPLFRAIEMVVDAQGFTERLFKRLRHAKCTFETKLMMMDLVSRMIGTHKLIILNYYSYIQRYLNTPTQQSITRILASFLQSCHELLPPDDLLSVVRTIADAFIVDRRPPDVICIGINAVRGVFVRVPHLLEEKPMQALVGDLVQFKKYRDKGVVVAARGLINDIRELYPELLQAKDRGRDHVKGKKPLAYGAVAVVQHDAEQIEGILRDDDEENGGGDVDDFESDEDEEAAMLGDAIVDPSDLEGLTKRLRQRKEERLAKVREGRSQHIKEKRGGSTNLEKKRRKNFNMVQQSAHVRSKLKRSLRQEQNALKKKIKKMRMDAKCSGKKINRRRK